MILFIDLIVYLIVELIIFYHEHFETIQEELFLTKISILTGKLVV